MSTTLSILFAVALLLWNTAITAGLAYALLTLRGKVMYTAEESESMLDSLEKMVKTTINSQQTVQVLVTSQLEQQRQLDGLKEELKHFESSVLFKEEAVC